MSVISLSIVESETEIISGIPSSISITANIPCNIFYTLDGTTPTIYSTIYIEPIILSGNQAATTLNVFATDGVNSSPIISNTYQTDLTSQNMRMSHSATNAPATDFGNFDPAPFGTPPIQPQQVFTGTGGAGINILNPDLPQIASGFDGSGNAVGFTNGQSLGIPSNDFEIKFSETNAQGERGNGIGTLPKSTIVSQPAEPEEIDIQSKFFDPRALVIVQDLTKDQDPGLPPVINRQHFSVENVNAVRDGNQYYNAGLSGLSTTGSLVRQHFNPAKNTITYYYFDSSQNRWIISTVPYTPKNNQYNYASSMVFGKSNKVFQWINFKASYLYWIDIIFKINVFLFKLKLATQDGDIKKVCKKKK